MKLTITREATTQLNEIYNAIEVHVLLDSADKFEADFFSKIDRLEKYPAVYSYSRIPILLKNKVRRIPIRQYDIFYQDFKNEVLILFVQHSKAKEWRKNRFRIRSGLFILIFHF